MIPVIKQEQGKSSTTFIVEEIFCTSPKLQQGGRFIDLINPLVMKHHNKQCYPIRASFG